MFIACFLYSFIYLSLFCKLLLLLFSLVLVINICYGSVLIRVMVIFVFFFFVFAYVVFLHMHFFVFLLIYYSLTVIFIYILSCISVSVCSHIVFNTLDYYWTGICVRDLASYQAMFYHHFCMHQVGNMLSICLTCLSIWFYHLLMYFPSTIGFFCLQYGAYAQCELQAIKAPQMTIVKLCNVCIVWGFNASFCHQGL